MVGVGDADGLDDALVPVGLAEPEAEAILPHLVPHTHHRTCYLDIQGVTIKWFHIAATAGYIITLSLMLTTAPVILIYSVFC